MQRRLHGKGTEGTRRAAAAAASEAGEGHKGGQPRALRQRAHRKNFQCSPLHSSSVVSALMAACHADWLPVQQCALRYCEYPAIQQSSLQGATDTPPMRSPAPLLGDLPRPCPSRHEGVVRQPRRSHTQGRSGTRPAARGPQAVPSAAGYSNYFGHTGDARRGDDAARVKALVALEREQCGRLGTRVIVQQHLARQLGAGHQHRRPPHRPHLRAAACQDCLRPQVPPSGPDEQRRWGLSPALTPELRASLRHAPPARWCSPHPSRTRPLQRSGRSARAPAAQRPGSGHTLATGP